MLHLATTHATRQASLSGLVDHFYGGPPDPNDPALATDLDLFVNGACSDSLSFHFRQWAEAMGRIRVQERSRVWSVSLVQFGPVITWRLLAKQRFAGIC